MFPVVSLFQRRADTRLERPRHERLLDKLRGRAAGAQRRMASRLR